MKRVGVALVPVLLLAATVADAQLYRWRDPQSGSLRVSSLPPPWFNRGVSQGPRVDVLIDGKVVDPAALTRRIAREGPATSAPPGDGLAPTAPPQQAVPLRD